MPYTYDYPQMGVTVDIVLLAKGEVDGVLRTLLIERTTEPSKGAWAFPGGYVDMDETTAVAAVRELEEETGVKGIELKRLDVFDKVDRNPQKRVISVAYGAMLENIVMATAGDDAANAEWYRLDALPALAFDHSEMLEFAVANL